MRKIRRRYSGSHSNHCRCTVRWIVKILIVPLQFLFRGIASSRRVNRIQLLMCGACFSQAQAHLSLFSEYHTFAVLANTLPCNAEAKKLFFVPKLHGGRLGVVTRKQVRADTNRCMRVRPGYLLPCKPLWLLAVPCQLPVTVLTDPARMWYNGSGIGQAYGYCPCALPIENSPF